MSDRLITVAIHTYDRALELKSLLESEGVEVALQNVNLESPVVSSGIRVRIHEFDLPVALRIIENPEIFKPAQETKSSKSPLVIVPVDFSDYSERACTVAFRMAELHKAEILLIHSYVDPMYDSMSKLSDMMSFDAQAADIDARTMIEDEAKRQMNNLSDHLVKEIKSGSLPAVKFRYEITEGVPEETINQYAKDRHPLLIVMGTRGSGTKERELVGSVTAEVLDTCRYPVLTIPESVNFARYKRIRHLIFFSNFDQEDILAIDAMFHLFPVDSLNVTLVKIPGKKCDPATETSSLKNLADYCAGHYSQHQFTTDILSVASMEDDFRRLTAKESDMLIAVPNKKKNIFARLFNPGIAHRLLFHADIPMIVIPV